jgi:hypothetical protein
MIAIQKCKGGGGFYQNTTKPPAPELNQEHGGFVETGGCCL